HTRSKRDWSSDVCSSDLTWRAPRSTSTSTDARSTRWSPPSNRTGSHRSPVSNASRSGPAGIPRRTGRATSSYADRTGDRSRSPHGEPAPEPTAWQDGQQHSELLSVEPTYKKLEAFLSPEKKPAADASQI